MNFTGTRKSTLAELALTHLYMEATRNTEDPSDDTELAYHTLEEALEELERYPTYQEVCTALSAELMHEVIYNERARSFYFWLRSKKGTKVITLHKGGGKYVVEIYLTPSSILTIAKFYEGLEREDSNA